MTDPSSRAYNFEYDELSALRRQVFPNGTESKTFYDNAGKVAQHETLTTATGAVLTRNGYRRDIRGSQLRDDGPEGTWIYSYDGLNRLEQAHSPATGRTRRYRHDRNSNRFEVRFNAGWGTSFAPNSWASTDGTPIAALQGSDDACAEQVLNFGFVFDGQTYDRVQVSSNGYVQLKTTSEAADCTAPTQDLVTTTKRIVAACATDITISANPLSQGVYVTLGNAGTGTPTRIRWKGFRKGTSNLAWCEMLLYPTTNAIEFRYGASLAAGPRIGVTPGDGVDFVAVAGYDGRAVPANAQNVTLSPAAESVQQAFSYNALDQLVADPATAVPAVAYNSDGDQTSITVGAREPVALGFDARHLVTSQTVSKTPALVTTWSIDGQSRVVSQTKGSSTTRYRFLGTSDTPAWEESSSGSVTTSFVSGPAGLLATYAGGTGGTPAFAVQNGHGDVIQTRDAAGALLETYTYDENGELTSAQTPTRYGYVGRWQKDREEDSGLIRMGVRFYDPMVGGFASWDPVDGGDWNAYTYAGANPCNRLDLTGTRVQEWDGYEQNRDGTYSRKCNDGTATQISRIIGFDPRDARKLKPSTLTAASARLSKFLLQVVPRAAAQIAVKALAAALRVGLVATWMNVLCAWIVPRERYRILAPGPLNGRRRTGGMS